MVSNYHTHSYHCRHAAGKPEDYVLVALQNGLNELGFSDHVPYPFSNGHRSGFRMEVSETQTYVEEILELREKYAQQIKIYVGYEAEYYPAEFEGMLRNICRYPVDYLICGQHFSNNEYDGAYNGIPTEDTLLLHAYVDQLSEAIGTGVFSYICHPDMFRFVGDDKAYEYEVLRLCDAAAAHNCPLEFNCLGFEEKRHYPSDRFWQIVATTRVPVVIGSDAHRPEKTGNPGITAAAKAKLAAFGITPISVFELRHPTI